MATPILMPQFGQMTEECVIVEWCKKEGDKIAKGDVLFTIETDKSAMDVESFEEGTLLKIVVPPGTSVSVRSTVGFLGTPGEKIAAVPAIGAAATPEAVKPDAGATPALPKGCTPAAAGGTSTDSTTPSVAATTRAPVPEVPAPRPQVSPRAAAMARDLGIDPAQISGSGPGGRVVETDVRAYVAARGLGGEHVSPAPKVPEARMPLHTGVDVAACGNTVATSGQAPAEEVRPMSRMRQVIAQRLAQSFREIPHFYVTVSVDMTDLGAFREKLKAAGAPYTITDFVSLAVVLTLQEFPQLNSSTDGKVVWPKNHINLGVAVSLEEGLVVPVIRAAERLTLPELSRQSRELVGRARDGRATPDELRGGTFTVSNMGMMDVESFSAIINPGEGAILAVASVQPQPVVREGKVDVRQMMKVTLSCDHRLVDGALGARFLTAVRQKLESPDLWRRLAV